MKEERKTMRKVFMVGAFALSLLSSLFVDTDRIVLAEASARNECSQWASDLGQTGDSAVMHEIGCDDVAPGVYDRTEGACAIDARRAYRMGLMPGTPEFRVRVANGETRCVLFEDGSWGVE